MSQTLKEKMGLTLLTGKPYVPASKTDIRKTFQRIKRELQEKKREPAKGV